MASTPTEKPAAVSLQAVIADGLNRGESDDQRQERRRASIARLRRECAEGGLSAHMTEELVTSLQKAFAGHDTMRALGALFGAR